MTGLVLLLLAAGADDDDDDDDDCGVGVFVVAEGVTSAGADEELRVVVAVGLAAFCCSRSLINLLMKSVLSFRVFCSCCIDVISFSRRSASTTRRS